MMDQWTKQIFDQANEVLYKVTATDNGTLTLTRGSEDTARLGAAVMKGIENSDRLQDAVAVLEYYAKYDTDNGWMAQAFLNRLAD